MRYTVKPLLADTLNSGHLPYSGQCAMYQVLFPFIPYLRPPLIDCLFPVRRPHLLLPAASLPFFSQVRHMRMGKSIKRYVTVLELTTHHDVQLFRTIFATVDLYYPTRPFDAIFVPTAGRTASIFQNGIIIITARPRVFDHVYGTGNNQSNTHGLRNLRLADTS